MAIGAARSHQAQGEARRPVAREGPGRQRREPAPRGRVTSDHQELHCVRPPPLTLLDARRSSGQFEAAALRLLETGAGRKHQASILEVVAVEPAVRAEQPVEPRHRERRVESQRVERQADRAARRVRILAPGQRPREDRVGSVAQLHQGREPGEAPGPELGLDGTRQMAEIALDPRTLGLAHGYRVCKPCASPGSA